MNNTIPLLIGWGRREALTKLVVTNPATGETVGQVSLANEDALDDAAAAARAAFDTTRRQAPYERADVLWAVVDGLRRRKDHFVDTLVAEAGKPVTLAEAEFNRAVMTFTASAELARRTPGELLDIDAFSSGHGHFGLARRFPIGVIYAITPFNFPLNLVAHKVGPCLATGNTMVLKPAPKTPLSALLLGDVLVEAGVPPGQVNVVPAPDALAGRLVADDRVAMVTFTGSAAVGWQVKRQAGTKRVTLELGGNAAVIVHDDADLPACIPPIAAGAFAYAGQSCISVQRIFVRRPIFDTFAAQFVEHTRATIKSGDPRDRDVMLGPMIDAAAVGRVTGWIDAAVAGGASLLLGGQARGRVMPPTILTNVTPAMDVCAKEVFAPVVVLVPYDSFDDALAMVNDSAYGLQAGVFTRDLGLAMRAFGELNVGAVLVNQVPTFRVETQPYGGVKDSGTGREGVRYTMEEMTEPRALIVKVE